MGLKEDTKENNIVLISTNKDNYNQNISNIQNAVNENNEKIGYVTINKPYNAIIQNLEKNNIDPDKFYFVDAITATVKSPPKSENCIFVNSPTALTDIGLAYSNLLNEKGCDVVLFDTISTLAVYQQASSVVKFVHNLLTKTRVLNKKAVFVALKEDSETLIKDLNMFVDKIVEI